MHGIAGIYSAPKLGVHCFLGLGTFGMAMGGGKWSCFLLDIELDLCLSPKP